jgi:hypothetical protein
MIGVSSKILVGGASIGIFQSLNQNPKLDKSKSKMLISVKEIQRDFTRRLHANKVIAPRIKTIHGIPTAGLCQGRKFD